MSEITELLGSRRPLNENPVGISRSNGKHGFFKAKPLGAGPVIKIDGQDGSIDVGAHGADGVLVLRDKDGTVTVIIDGKSGGLCLSGDFEVFGKSTTKDLEVTGTTWAADIIITNSAGERMIEIDRNLGDIRFLNADCAEDFDIAEAEDIEPGTVMVLDHKGELRQSSEAYDKKVAGVVSGAGGLKPGIILDQQQKARGKRLPIALIGKVYCKVDADYAPIQIGDLLTTSPTPGHAMKVSDTFKAFGTVLGKALHPLEAGKGLIPVLVALQ